MKFIEKDISGVFEVKIEPHNDERGFFSRIWCKKEFEQYNLETEIVQCNIAYNKKKGIVRGMHYQKGENAEVKVVSCISGSVYDVVIDLRKNSATFGKWLGCKLSADEHNALYIPKGFAHGYQTLTQDATLSYMVSSFYAPDSEDGVRYNDPKFAIKWPLQITGVSEKDKKWQLIK